jgi:hypothetical protein
MRGEALRISGLMEAERYGGHFLKFRKVRSAIAIIIRFLGRALSAKLPIQPGPH